MVRISKDPDERKSEIIETAYNLFMTNGFEETAVSDIVKAIGVAQGTFYYYFKSKEEILDAVINRIINEILGKIDDVIKDPAMNAIQKFITTIDVLLKYAIGTESLANYVHMEKNAQMHQRFAGCITSHLVPEFAQIIEQGNREGLFNTSYPEETAHFVLFGLSALHDELSKLIYDDQEQRKKLLALDEIITRCLGAKKGSLKFLDLGGKPDE
ncbi:MAG: TetR/AcrR family transcriptional regulator [Clostridia bacterium]|nr:TetR/AcrR family transcriptional regulator [Clostridia bacterium]